MDSDLSPGDFLEVIRSWGVWSWVPFEIDISGMQWEWYEEGTVFMVMDFTDRNVSLFGAHGPITVSLDEIVEGHRMGMLRIRDEDT